MRSIFSALILLALAASAQAGEVDRLYVIDCGWAHASDQSRWSSGVNVGVPIDLSDNCYLIHHSSEGYLLWDTGITDRLAALPEGRTVPALGQTWHRTWTLVAALAALGVKPADVRYVAISHWHPDHTGNVDEFPDATVIIQKAERDYVITLPQKPFSPEHKMQQIEGDKDLFGDGSLTILSTPGHTPGHQSLLVHLPKTGYVVLSAMSCISSRTGTIGGFPTSITTKPNRLRQWRRSRVPWTRSTRSSGSTTTSRQAMPAVTRRNSTNKRRASRAARARGAGSRPPEAYLHQGEVERVQLGGVRNCVDVVLDDSIAPKPPSEFREQWWLGRLHPCDASSAFGSRAPQAVLQRKAANLLGSSVSGAASPRGWPLTRQRGRTVVQLRQKGNGGLTRPWVITITRKRGREAGGVVKSKDDIPAKLAADF